MKPAATLIKDMFPLLLKFIGMYIHWRTTSLISGGKIDGKSWRLCSNRDDIDACSPVDRICLQKAAVTENQMQPTGKLRKELYFPRGTQYHSRARNSFCLWENGNRFCMALET